LLPLKPFCEDRPRGDGVDPDVRSRVIAQHVHPQRRLEVRTAISASGRGIGPPPAVSDGMARGRTHRSSARDPGDHGRADREHWPLDGTRRAGLCSSRLPPADRHLAEGISRCLAQIVVVNDGDGNGSAATRPHDLAASDEPEAWNLFGTCPFGGLDAGADEALVHVGPVVDRRLAVWLAGHQH
jgi:hypothetical protein